MACMLYALSICPSNRLRHRDLSTRAMQHKCMQTCNKVTVPHAQGLRPTVAPRCQHGIIDTGHNAIPPHDVTHLRLPVPAARHTRGACRLRQDCHAQTHPSAARLATSKGLRFELVSALQPCCTCSTGPQGTPRSTEALGAGCHCRGRHTLRCPAAIKPHPRQPPTVA